MVIHITGSFVNLNEQDNFEKNEPQVVLQWQGSFSSPQLIYKQLCRLHVFVFVFCFKFCFDLLVPVSAQFRVTVANQHDNIGQDSLFSVIFNLCIFLRGSFFNERLSFYACIDIVLNLASRDARVVKDTATGKSKGYGFVSFYNKLVRLQCKNTE